MAGPVTAHWYAWSSASSPQEASESNPNYLRKKSKFFEDIKGLIWSLKIVGDTYRYPIQYLIKLQC